MLKEKLEQRKCFPTAWGKLITEEEAYRQLNRADRGHDRQSVSGHAHL